MTVADALMTVIEKYGIFVGVIILVIFVLGFLGVRLKVFIRNQIDKLRK